MHPVFFPNATAFRTWLEHHHQTETELWVGYYKVATGKPSMTWSESVDQALCFGWIDGLRKSVDAESYCIRFTPRKPDSIWSAVNLKKVESLTREGLMRPAGLDIFSRRKPEKSELYSFENEPARLSEAYENLFKASSAAWAFFTAQAPSYQKTIIHWIMAAKKEETQRSRLMKAISESEKNKRVI
jgi:uncharacterized protein YdeI (YjbR/CyaY-like superfamily)